MFLFNTLSILLSLPTLRRSRQGCVAGLFILSIQSGQSRLTSSLFQSEPLYQFYDGKDGNNNTADTKPGTQENVYETVASMASSSRSLAPDTVAHRSLWAELPEVMESGILATISPKEKKLQEAKSIYETIRPADSESDFEVGNTVR